MRANRNKQPTNRSLIVAAALALTLTACGGGDGTDDTMAAEDAATTDTTSAGDGDATEEATDDDSMDDSAEDASDDDMADGDMDDDSSDGMDMDDEMDMDMSGDYGDPANASEADRVIEVNVDNDLAFEPSEFEVAAGEVVTFSITNSGDVEHEFVLGDQEAQDQMAEMMESGDDHAHSGDMSNAVTIHAGETAELTWSFTSPGTVLIG